MIGYKYPSIASGATYIRSYLMTNKIGAIDYLSSTTNFDFIIDKKKIDYSHRELFMRL
jgi:hypothetical protein